MRIKNYFMILIFLVLSITSYKGVNAMGLSDAGKVCLFSAMTGVIKLDGKPVSGARLVRTVKKEKKNADETITDNNGYFEFDAIFSRTITKYLPMEFVVNQQINVFYNDKEYEMWSGVKREPEENAESRGKPLVVECELNREVSLIEVNGSPIFSLCSWDVEPDPKPEVKFFSNN